MRMVIEWFLLTASLLALSGIHCLPVIEGPGEEGSLLQGGYGGLTQEVDKMKNFFREVASLNRTVRVMSRQLSNITQFPGDNSNNTMSSDPELNNSTDRLATLEDEIQSLHTGLDRVNISLKGVETRMEVLEEGLTKIQLDEIIQNPRAKLYRRLAWFGIHFEGDFEYYDFISAQGEGGCYNLTVLGGNIQTVQTVGKCIRVFKDYNCRSWSQAFYPGSNVNADVLLEGSRSVGPCGANEFEHATLQYSERLSSKVVKKSDTHVQAYAAVPDIIGDIWSFKMSAFRFINRYNDPSYIFYEEHNMTYVREGTKTRVESVYGVIYAFDILTTESAKATRIRDENQTVYSQLDLNTDTDEPGFALPLELGGPAGKWFNVFPQNKAKVDEYRSVFVPPIKKYLKEYPDDPVLFSLTFKYPDDFSKRPAGFWYRLEKTGTGEVTYGYLSN